MTRKRRSLISAAVLAACVCIALGVLAMMPPRPGVTKANFDRIKEGMTLEEVTSIFGSKEASNGVVAGTIFSQKCDRYHRWEDDDWSCSATVGFRENQVMQMVWSGERRKKTFTDKLRRWLRLPE